MMKRFVFVMLAVAATFAQSPAGRALAAARSSPTLEKNLRALTDEVGGRVPGTPAMRAAVNWAAKAMEADADSLAPEHFMMPATWAEGDTRLEITAPVNFRARALSVAWAPALPKTHLRIVDVGEGKPEDFARASNVTGALILVHSHVLKTWEDLFAEYLEAPPVIEAAVKAKVAVIAWMATREHDILYRHINTLNGKIDRLPQLVVAREDAERMARLLASGKRLEADVSIPNVVGPAAQTANLVAELRGSERPDEYVLLGAHLDSWNLGTGALDNGCDAALVIDALRAIKAAGVKPKRSIRFVLFSGEEQGMLGSLAYVRQHRADMDKIAGVIIFDEGTGATTGFSLGGREDIKASVAALLGPLAEFKATELTTDAFVGTDNLDFLLEGVPTLVANQQEANYLVNYHATSDTFDKVDLAQLQKHVAIAAYFAVALADAPRIGPRQSRAEIEQLMQKTQLDQQLKTFGLWSEWQNGTRGRK